MIHDVPQHVKEVNFVKYYMVLPHALLIVEMVLSLLARILIKHVMMETKYQPMDVTNVK